MGAALQGFGDRCDQYIELLRYSDGHVALDDARRREHKALALAVREGRTADLELVIGRSAEPAGSSRLA